MHTFDLQFFFLSPYLPYLGLKWTGCYIGYMSDSTYTITYRQPSLYKRCTIFMHHKPFWGYPMTWPILNANHDSRVRWNNSLVDQVAGSRESPGLTKAPRHLRKRTLIISDVRSRLSWTERGGCLCILIWPRTSRSCRSSHSGNAWYWLRVPRHPACCEA